MEFSLEYGYVTNKLISCIFVGAPHSEAAQMKEYNAMWDTGASMTQVSRRVINEINAISVGGIYKCDTPAGIVISESYAVHLGIPFSYSNPALEVIVSEIGGSGYDVLIGMDIIGLGDFMVTNFGGKTTLAFRYPSTGEIGLSESCRIRLIVSDSI